VDSCPKVLLLAMDAGNSRLIQDWAADGTLPNIRSLLSRGLVGQTASLAEFFVGATWPSFYTGVTPAKHGIHSLVQLTPGTYQLHRCFTGEGIRRKPFWHYLSQAGRKLAIFDIPLSGISRGLNGIQLVEWGSHDAYYGFCAWPAGLKEEVIGKFGRYPLEGSCDSHGRSPQDFVRFKDALVGGVRKKAELTGHYLKQAGWDFFAQVFTESHCVGHQCWHLHDPAHPGFDPRTAEITGDPIKDVYAAIDRAFGELLSLTGRDTIVILLAAHGMNYMYGSHFLLPEILIRLERPSRRRRRRAARLTWLTIFSHGGGRILRHSSKRDFRSSVAV